MKYKTLTRILIKLIGVYLFLTNLPILLVRLLEEIVGRIELATIGSTDVLPITFEKWNSFPIVTTIFTAIGLYLLLFPNFLTNKIIPSNRPYCPDCGYDLTNNPSPQCPECGTSLPTPNKPHTQDNPA